MVSFVVESPVFTDTVVPFFLLELKVIEEEVLSRLEFAHVPDSFALALGQECLLRLDR